MEEKVKIQAFEDYLNDRGLFYDFKKYIEEQGYTLAEFGIEEEDQD